MRKRTLHIISFNIPFPANYGGVIDVFYKIKALHAEGIAIILHAFEYGRTPAPELKKYCSKIYYYHRPISLLAQVSSLPFIVKSRHAKELLQNLQLDDHPILFEGLHTCYFLQYPQLKDRKKYIRMHNVEWEYYSHLAKMEPQFFKKKYFKIESWKLKRFEKIVTSSEAILAISKNDTHYFSKKYSTLNTQYIPAFHPNDKVMATPGKGEYILFHGDLSVKDNANAVIFLLEKIMQHIDYQLIVAGLNPSQMLKEKINQYKNVNLEANVSNERMDDLIKNAHVNILLSFQSAGMKLKLLNALFKGRFCVVNNFMIKNTGLEECCEIGNQPLELQKILKDLFRKEFSDQAILLRKEKLETLFSNQNTAKKIMDIIF